MSGTATYALIPPDDSVAHLVDCFWVVVDDDAAPSERKIVPDGFPELVFHHGDPYEIRPADGAWTRQPHALAAGQFSRYFFLRNTGRTDITGVKLQPWALAQLSGRAMAALTDRVPALEAVFEHAEALEAAAGRCRDTDARIAALSQALLDIRPAAAPPETVTAAIAMIVASQGRLPVTEIGARLGMHPRSLERAFAQWIGLTPKLYSRVIRLSAIFKAASGERGNLSDLSFHAGYYDQPHFHREFKAFTGDNPSKYPFARQDMANLFLNRP